MKDSRNRVVRDNDVLHRFLLVPDGDGERVELAMWATDRSLTTRDTDLWEVQENLLETAWQEYSWPPGTYQVVSESRFSGARLGETTRPMPLPPAYARLGKTPRDGLPARGFVRTLLARYPGSTLEQVSAHIETFDAHWWGRVGSAELAERTGYTLPEDTPRPQHPDAVVPDAMA